MTAANPIASWHADHARFTRLLHFLDVQLGTFRRGEDPDYALMRDTVWFLQDFADRVHHPRENEAFRRLVQHDPALALPVNRLLQEHRVIGNSGDVLLRLLDAVLEDAVVSREEVEAAAATYLLYYHHHILEEEREMLPRAARLLSPKDWSAVAAAVPATPDPLIASADARYHELRHQLEVTDGAPKRSNGVSPRRARPPRARGASRTAPGRRSRKDPSSP